MRKLITFLICASAVTWAQANPQPSTADAPPASPNAAPQNAAPKTDIGPNTPVITLHGFCPDKPPAEKAAADCETVITRAAFEKLVSTLAPNAPNSARQQLAGDYARFLVLATEAKKDGLDKTDRFKEIMDFMHIRVLAQELLTNLQQQAKPTPEQVQKYYEENKAKYEQSTLSRVFIPRNHPVNEKPTAAKDAKPAAPAEATDAELQAQADKARARLAAGESFEDVQKEVYESAGYKTPPPPTTIPNWRRDTAPAEQRELFDLKQGELSKVKIEPAGAYIYRVDEKKEIPLEQARPEMEQQLQNQNMQQLMTGITSNIKPDFNREYFEKAAGEPEKGGPMPPRVMRPGSQNELPPKPAAKPATSRPAATAKSAPATPKK